MPKPISRGRSLLWALLAALLGLALFQAKEARASTFDVNPIRVTLSPRASSGLVTVRNTSAESLRFQVSAFTWRQSVGGEMELLKTSDIVFFPAMLSLKPGESRNIRVGTLASFGDIEKTYRIFVEELPPASPNLTNSIRVLTRFGIPVFLEANKPSAAPRIEGMSLLGRRLSFSLKNAGNTHFLTQLVRVQALGPDGGSLMEKELPAWYVLAGGARSYAFDLPASACGAERLVVSIKSDAKPVETSLAGRVSPCGP